KTGEWKAEFACLDDQVTWTADGRLVLVDEGGVLRLCDVSTRQQEAMPVRGLNTLYPLTISPDGSRLAGLCDDGQLKLWDVRSGELLKTLIPKEEIDRQTRLTFSPDGTTLAGGFVRGRIVHWDAATGKRRSDLPLEPGIGLALTAMTPDLRTAALEH